MKNVLTMSALAAVLSALAASARTQPADLETRRTEWEETWTQFTNAVAKGGSLVLANDVCQFGAAVSVASDFRLDLNGHTVWGDDGQRLFTVDAGTLTLADGSAGGAGRIVGSGAADKKTDGAAILVRTGATCVLEGGALTGYSTPKNRGGAVSVSTGAAFEMRGGAIADCSAGAGGAVCLFKDASFRLKGGAITNCSSAGVGGAIVSFTTNAVVSGGTIAGCTSKGGEAISLSTDAALTICGGLFRRTPEKDFVGSAGRLTVCGGVSDFAWPELADGYEDVPVGDFHWVIRTGTWGVAKDGCLVRGDFCADPKTALDAGVGADSRVVVTLDESVEPALWRLRLPLGAVFTNTVEGVDLTFVSKGETAQVGDGVHAAADEACDSFIFLPSVSCGYPLDAVAAGAFATCTNSWGFIFRGQPIASVASDAFPEFWPGYYPVREKAAWEAVIKTEKLIYEWEEESEETGGTVTVAVTNDYRVWQKLIMDVNPYVYRWSELVDLVDHGCTAYLMQDLVQDGGELSVTNGETGVYALENATVALADGCRFARVGAGGRLELDAVTVVGSGTAVAGNGGLVQVEAGGTFLFSSGCLTNGWAESSGGAISVEPDGACVMGSAVAWDEAVIAGCRADGGVGGAVAVGGTFALLSGTVADNAAAGDGGGVGTFPDADAADVEIFGGCVCGNATERQGSALACRGGEINVYGGVFLGNAPAMSTVYRAEGAFRISGGVFDAMPTEKAPLMAEGFAAYAVGSNHTAAWADSVSFNQDGAFLRGAFTFDPSDELYAAYLPLDASCEIVWVESDTNAPYHAVVRKGGPYVARITSRDRTYDYTYYLDNGNAVLGGENDPALKVAADERVPVPGEINGFAVTAIAAGAFTNQTQAKEFVFLGLPPECGADALPAGSRVSYSLAYEDEWKAVIVDGKWNGYTVSGGACYDWATLKAVLEAGRSVTLGYDIAQDGEGIVLTAGADVTLTLDGKTITGLADTAFATIDGKNARLTVRDPGGTGRIVGSGDATGVEIREGQFVLAGGTLGGYRQSAVHVSAGATFTLRGGRLSGNFADRGAAVLADGVCAIEGGTVSGNTATTDGAAVYVTGTGTLVLSGGTVTDNACAASGAGVLSGNGLLTLTGGKVTGAENLYAVLVGGRALFYGGYYPAVGTTCPLKANGGSGEIWGGIYEGSLDGLLSGGAVLTGVGYEGFTDGTRTFYAKKDSLSLSEGFLTCGIFTFNPFADEYAELEFFKARERVVVTPAGGSPATWTLGVTYVVPCQTWEQLMANISVGNRVSLDVDFKPPADHKMPTGFVYRGRVVDDADQGVTAKVGVTLRLYREVSGGDPVWTSAKTDVTPKSEGVFQIWVGDDLRKDAYQPALQDVFREGAANYLTVAFDGGSECSPRRALVTTPLVNRACETCELDDTVTLGLLYTGTNGTVTAGALNAGNVVCGTFEVSVSNLAYNVSEMRLGGCTLYRNAENRILSSTDGAWREGPVATGETLLSNAPKSGLLTIQSTDGCTVPSVVVPVPRGGSFTWQSTPFTGRWRFTPFGSN